MKALSLHQERSRLKAIRALAPTEPETQQQSHFARYYCVLICGFFENCLKIIVNDFTKCTGRSETSNYVSVRISRFSDIGKQELSSFVHSFSNHWGALVDSEIEGSIGAALDSAKNIRNQVAHGGVVSTSLGQIDGYFEEIDKLVTFLSELFA